MAKHDRISPDVSANKVVSVFDNITSDVGKSLGELLSDEGVNYNGILKKIQTTQSMGVLVELLEGFTEIYTIPMSEKKSFYEGKNYCYRLYIQHGKRKDLAKIKIGEVTYALEVKVEIEVLRRFVERAFIVFSKYSQI